jgi:mannose-6-phosphate isomerase-like protein (cupin superfamily)
MALYENNFLVAEAHLPPRVSAKRRGKFWEKVLKVGDGWSSPAHVHPTQKHAFLPVHIDSAVVMQTVQGRGLVDVRSRSIELRLDGVVVLLVNNVIHRIAVDQQVLHRVSQVLSRIVRDVQKLAILSQHHEKARKSLR